MSSSSYVILEVPEMFRAQGEDTHQVFAMRSADSPLDYVMDYTQLQEICETHKWHCPDRNSNATHNFPSSLESAAVQARQIGHFK